MTIGICIMAHAHLRRVAELARHLADRDCRVAIHVDSATPQDDYSALAADLSDHASIILVPRQRCEWGTFRLLKASLDTARALLDAFDDVENVTLISGACLPIRAIEDFQKHLAAHPDTDFVESRVVGQDRWVQEGLEEERFTLYHPFSWRRHRRLFDLNVELQRRLRVRRAVPEGLEMAIGSQWWTLTRKTLTAILNDPRRARYDRFFRSAWIVDESYIQTLVRNHSRNLVSRSMTLTEFDPQGKPFTFYDDHAQILEDSDKFFARKIWHGANALYSKYLYGAVPLAAERRKERLDLPSLVEHGRARRCNGRSGLLSQSRFPCRGFEAQPATAQRYLVLEGYDFLFEGLPQWLRQQGFSRPHGRLFRQGRVEFAGGAATVPGGLTNDPRVRDWNPQQFLTNLLWHDRDQSHAFMFTTADNPKLGAFILRDPNATVCRISGAWALGVLPSLGEGQDAFRARIAHLKALEAKRTAELQTSGIAATVHQVSLADVLKSPEQAFAPIASPTPMANGNVMMLEQTLPLLRRDLSPETLIQQLEAVGIATAATDVLPLTAEKTGFRSRVLRARVQ